MEESIKEFFEFLEPVLRNVVDTEGVLTAAESEIVLEKMKLIATESKTKAPNPAYYKKQEYFFERNNTGCVNYIKTFPEATYTYKIKREENEN